MQNGDHSGDRRFAFRDGQRMNASRHDPTLVAMLRETPHDEHDAVCAAWEALAPARQQYLAGFPPAFVVQWLRGQLTGWDDDAPLNALPEGGYARQVAFPSKQGGSVRLWCLVSARAATIGELIHCHDGVDAAAGTLVQLELTDDGFARAVVPAPSHEQGRP
jgi:hypothetical protein